MPKAKNRLSVQEQLKRFQEKAKELAVDDSEEGQEKAFGKVGMKRSLKEKLPKKE